MSFEHISTFFDIFSLSRIRNLTARIEDGDSDFEADLWTRHDGCSGNLIPVRPDRWYDVAEVIDSQDCSGIRCNIWERAKFRRLITHRLVGGGPHNIGFDALPWEMCLRGDAGKYGHYAVLSVLPDKLARFLFEYHSDLYKGLNLPVLPEDRSQIDVHGLLKPQEVMFCFCIHIMPYYTVFLYILTYFDIFLGKGSARNPSGTELCQIHGTSQTLYNPAYWTQETFRRSAYLVLAVCILANENGKSSRLRFCSASRDFSWRVSAQDRQCLVLQSSVSIFLCVQE